jgi:hypothetical protein
MHGDDQEPPADLRALRLDAERYESLARRIEAAARPDLIRRAEGGVQHVLAKAMWPALVAAAAAVVAVVGLRRGSSSEVETSLAVSGIEQVLPGGTADAAWIEEQRAPTDDDLMRALGLGTDR